jgi:hypothetical protein
MFDATAPKGVVYPDKTVVGCVMATKQVTENGQPLVLAQFADGELPHPVWVPLNSLKF